MRICYIAFGGSIHTKRWVDYFAVKGHDVHLITPERVCANFIEGVKIHPLKGLGPRIGVKAYLINAIPFLVQTKALVKRIQPHLVHAHYIMGPALLGALSGVHPLVLTAWGSDVSYLTEVSKIRKWTVKLALTRADLITCDAEHIRRTLVGLGADPKTIATVGFGTDTRNFSPKKRSESIRTRLGIFNSPAVISRRFLEPLYDVESLINAIPLVLREVPDAKFVIAASGPQEGELRELAKSLGVTESIRFIGGIDDKDFPEYIASADIYVSTSLSDAGISASTAEAMSCGLPVITTDFGDNGRWIINRRNGFLVPLRDPRMLAQKIIWLANNEDTRKRFGRINRAIIKKRNDYCMEMEKMEHLYMTLVDL